ncbi:MAG: hypothetical protein K6B75_01910 [Lachnospiraceae bacterium]|nr:hypothetical protein [Lachnospiraceae bacterium]
MKRCTYCKIEVGGNPEKCPLCQSRLVGDGEEAYFPEQSSLQFRSFLYKVQMFIVWALIFTGLGLDFFIGLRFKGFPDLHWSLVFAMWLVAFEFGIMKQFRPGASSAKKVSMVVLILTVLVVITSYYFDFMWLTRDWIVPIVIAATLIANFVLTMLDKNGNAMAYLLSSLLFGLIPFWIMYARHKGTPMPMPWIICLIISITLLAGIIIFKGRAVAKEFQKRFHI